MSGQGDPEAVPLVLGDGHLDQVARQLLKLFQPVDPLGFGVSLVFIIRLLFILVLVRLLEQSEFEKPLNTNNERL